MADFNEELFGCFSDFVVCLWSFVPGGICCIQAKAVDKALGEGAIIPYLFPAFLLCIGGALNRGKIRVRYSLEGSFPGDCCLWTFCACCASIQEYKEVNKR